MLIHDIAFHDLRHDFAQRARMAGWSLEAVACGKIAVHLRAG